MSALFDAIKSHDVARVEALLRTDPSLAVQPGPGGMTPLTLALYVRLAKAVDALVAAGAAPTPHELAAMGRAREAAAAVEADPGLLLRTSPDGWPMLHYAAHFGHVETLRALVALGAGVEAKGANEMGNAALHAAAAGGATGAVLALLEAGADPDARDAGGHTALMNAAAQGNVDMCEALVRAGADVNAANKDGATAASFAAKHDEDEMVAWLRARGAR